MSSPSKEGSTTDQKTLAVQDILLVANVAKRFIDREGLDYPDGFQGIGISELRDLGRDILDCRTLVDGYELFARAPKRGGACFYDRLIGIQHQRAYNGLATALNHYERSTVERGLDVASGTGECALELAGKVDTVVAVDVCSPLLKVAEGKLRRKKSFKRIQTKVMDALSLSFPESEQFDIVVCNALRPYLSYDQQVAFYRNVYNVLKPGGRYYEYQTDNAELNNLPYNLSPRARLAEHVVSALLLLRENANQPNDPRGLPDPEKFGFDVIRLILHQREYIEQVVKYTK